MWIGLLGLGGAICAVNAYVSFLRYPIHRLRGRTPEEIRRVSGFPVVGSLLVVVSLIGLWDDAAARTVGLALILIDTGGLHWFAGVMVYQWLVRARSER